jgi:protein-tyrosine-phosphatase
MSESGVLAANRWRERLASEADGSEAAGDLHVVFVCTGNRFRSPLAEAAFRKWSKSVPVHVSSLGTVNAGPLPPFPETFEQSRRLGLDLSSHRARSIAKEELRRADVVVGFERGHIATAVVDYETDRDRVFTLPELVELIELEDGDPPRSDDPVANARGSIERAAALRLAMGRPPGRPEIPDPVTEPEVGYARTADEIDDLVARLARGLFG